MMKLDLYTSTSYALSRQLTEAYSTSFSLASRLFSGSIRPHIYAIYGMVRIADEIVDTYRADDMAVRLDALEAEVYAAVESGYSTNPLLHAYGHAARQFGIENELVKAFFESMRMDIDKTSFTKEEYEAYIYGSAEVIGLMCLRVFTDGDSARYDELAPGARRLGAAYQKVNFLRDIAADHSERARVYFPGVDFSSFDDAAKSEIEADIAADFEQANEYIPELPDGARKAVRASYEYYSQLLVGITHVSAEELKSKRISVPSAKKLVTLAKVAIS